MNLKPIHNDDDYAPALQAIDRLWDAADGTAEADTLEIIVTLVEAYEAEHYPIPAPDPIEMILHVMDARGLTRRDLEPYLGSRARVSEVLNRRRPLDLTGNEVLLTQAQKPVMRLVPVANGEKARIAGLHAGMGWMSEDFDDALQRFRR